MSSNNDLNRDILSLPHLVINVIFIILALIALVMLLGVQAQDMSSASSTPSAPSAWLNALNVLPFAAVLLAHFKPQKWFGMVAVVLNALWLLMFLFVVGSAASGLTQGNGNAWFAVAVSVCVMAVCAWNLKQVWQVATQNERFL